MKTTDHAIIKDLNKNLDARANVWGYVSIPQKHLKHQIQKLVIL